jgi:hypothetical protein
MKSIKPKSLHRIGLLVCGLLLGALALAGPLDLGPQVAKKVRYPEYDAQGQLKFEVMGDEAQVLPDGLIHVVNLKLVFYEEGRVMMRVTASECFLDRVKQIAASTSDVCVARSDMVLTGIGYEFMWENNQCRLNIVSQTKVVLSEDINQ